MKRTPHLLLPLFLGRLSRLALWGDYRSRLSHGWMEEQRWPSRLYPASGVSSVACAVQFWNLLYCRRGLVRPPIIKIFPLVGLLIEFCSLLSCPLSGQCEIVPDERRANWQPGVNLGVSGGIPERAIIFVNVLTTENSSYKCAGDGVTDDSTPLQNAILACPAGQVVYCPAANYLISNRIAVTRNNFVLRGDGPGLTVFLANTTGPSFQFNSGEWTPLSSRTANISSGYTKGSSTIVLASIPTSLAVGCLLVIDQLNDETNVTAHGQQGLCTWTDRPHDGTRNRAQMVQVTSAFGTTVTFFPPLNNDYDASFSPEATTYPTSKFQTSLGFENLTIKNINPAGADLIQLEWAYQSWVKNVEFDNVVGHGLFLDHTLQCEFRQCYFHDAMSYTVGNGYGLTSMNTWNCLYEDNIFYHLYDSLTVEGGNGCVVGYNYISHTYDGPAPSYMIVGISAHSPQESMILYEGNIANEFQADFTWGSSDYLTLFRNYFAGNDAGITSNRRCVSLDNHTLNSNVVGNVLGDPTVSSWTYSMPQTSGYSPSNSVIYRFGFPSIGNNTFTSATNDPGSNDLDTRVAPSMLIHGNFDYFTNSTVWDPSIPDRTIPNSLYYSSQPDWWPIGVVWPPIGPDLVPMVGQIPAEIRFLTQSTPTPTPTATATPTPTPISTATPAPTPTPTPTPTATPTASATPTATATPTSTPHGQGHHHPKLR